MRHLKSSWASPLHMVKKKDGTWRPCMDIRQLNQATKQDLYPPPHIEDLSTKLEGMKVFSTIGLRRLLTCKRQLSSPPLGCGSS